MFTRSHYLQMAQEAARLSEAATSEENRVIWLKIAEGYRELADIVDAQAAETCDEDARDDDD
jgi:hypothetical protein